MSGGKVWPNRIATKRRGSGRGASGKKNKDRWVRQKEGWISIDVHQEKLQVQRSERIRGAQKRGTSYTKVSCYSKRRKKEKKRKERLTKLFPRRQNSLKRNQGGKEVRHGAVQSELTVKSR